MDFIFSDDVEGFHPFFIQEKIHDHIRFFMLHLQIAGKFFDTPAQLEDRRGRFVSGVNEKLFGRIDLGLDRKRLVANRFHRSEDKRSMICRSGNYAEQIQRQSTECRDQRHVRPQKLQPERMLFME